MKQRNCPNCGAPYEIELNTCPYCGTSYFDMSAIDIGERRPFYLKIKMNGMVFTSKVVAEPDVQINLYENTYDILGKHDEKITSFIVDRGMDINMCFKSVHNSDLKEALYTLEVKDDVERS